MFDQVRGVTYNIYRMKTRVLLTMLIIFIVVSGVCITCGTIFVVRDIEVVDVTVQTANPLSDEEKNNVIEQSGLRGKNILFSVNHEQITQKIKAVDPMLKLQSVTAKFPNRVVLVVSRRVPVFYDNNFMYDAEMCVVGSGTALNLVNITGAKLALVDNLNPGDLAVGKDKRSQAKINQIKVVANYFESLEDFEISYNDEAGTVGKDRFCLLLKINTHVTFKIIISPDEDFLNALEFTDQIYNTQQVNGVYKTIYMDNSNKVHTSIRDAADNILKDQTGKEMIYEEE